MSQRIYSTEEAATRLAGELPAWSAEQDSLRRTYKTANFRASLLLANAVGHLAEVAWHHPDLTVSYGALDVSLTSHKAGGITDSDFALAAKIEELVTWRPGQSEGPLEGTPEDPRYAYINYE